MVGRPKADVFSLVVFFIPISPKVSFDGQFRSSRLVFVARNAEESECLFLFVVGVDAQVVPQARSRLDDLVTDEKAVFRRPVACSFGNAGSRFAIRRILHFTGSFHFPRNAPNCAMGSFVVEV